MIINKGIFSEKLAKIKVKKIAVAVSGGSDSLALTLLLNEYCFERKIELFAITIDHGIRKSSALEAKKLGKILADKKISHQILTIPKAKIPAQNIEANLRELRYEMLYDFCTKNEIQHLFLGHILGDIAENFLIRLFRGSGLDGLSSIAEISNYKDIKLLRPLLNYSKAELQEYLQTRGVQWFEDETNEDEKFLRNKIRKFLNSLPEAEIIQKRIKNAADEITKSRDLFDEILLIKAKKILKLQREKNGEKTFLIDIKKLQKLDEKTALKILALTLMEVGGKPYKPRLEKLKNFYNYLQTGAIKKRNFYNCMAKKFDEKTVVIFAEKKPLNSEKFNTILSKIF